MNDLTYIFPLLVSVFLVICLFIVFNNVLKNERRRKRTEETNDKIKLEVMYKLTIIGKTVNDTDAKEIMYTIYVPKEVLAYLYSEIGATLGY
jgi:hypothetical protein